MARALVPLAEGFEEIETSTIVDVLRRGEVEVVLAGIAGDGPVLGSRGMRFTPDCAFDEVEGSWDLVVLPGGAQGAERLSQFDPLLEMIRNRVASGQLVAAICAAPQVLDRAGVLPDGSFTCYPGWESRLRSEGRQHEAVVETPAVITSQGPATAMEFALTLLERLRGPGCRQEVARGLLFTV